MIKDVLKDAEARMKSAVAVLEEDLMGLRTGRPQRAGGEAAGQYYGTPAAFQLATICAGASDDRDPPV